MSGIRAIRRLYSRAVEDDQFDTKLNEDWENPWNPNHQRLTVL